MIRVTGRGGHNYKFTGAIGIVEEVKEVRAIMKELSFLLATDNDFDYEEATPNTTNTLTEDLAFGVKRANDSEAALFFSLHLNSTDKAVIEEGVGSEVLIYTTSKNEVSGLCGEAICKELGALGFKNRGLKTSASIDNLYEIRETVMPSMIIEAFFVNSKTDVRLYKALGSKTIATAIYKGIKKGTGSNTPYVSNNSTPNCSNCKNYYPL